MSNRAIEVRGDTGAAAVERLVRPRSVAIVGISSKPGSAGHTVLANLVLNQFAGDIHLVGRSGGEIEGRRVLSSLDELPMGVEVAIFTLPAAAVKDAVAGCVARGVKTAVIFAAGFAEMGDEERHAQEEITRMAAAGGLRLLGPNCLGYANHVDGFAAGFAGARAVAKVNPAGGPALAIVSQSGGLMGHLQSAFQARGLQVSYTISSGNEADLGLADFIDFLVDDETSKGVVIYVEDVRDPAAFLAAAAKARARNKPVIMMHPGRGKRGQEATKSHTGALAGDYKVMKMQAEHAGIAFVETLEEMVDVAEILARFPEAPIKGAGILTFSGAFCAIAYDYCEDLGLDVPLLTPETQATIQKRLPAFATARNPLDLTTQPIWEPDLMEIGARALLEDPNTGSLTISIPAGNPTHSVIYAKGLVNAMKGNRKPVVFSVLGDGAPLPPDFMTIIKENGIVLLSSSERALRATAAITRHGRRLATVRSSARPRPIPGLPKLGHGTQSEWVGKRFLAAAGIAIPAGALARTADEAVAVAARVGFPVAMKAQAAALAHKTEAGGVLLNLHDEAGVRKGWATLAANVERAKPGLVLEGALVEAMAGKGIELVVGARRDPKWGPVVMVGLGGVFVEALGDVRLLPPDLPEAAIVEELGRLEAAKLLDGFRGAPPVDKAAVARVVATVGRVMVTNPDIAEIDVNPLVATDKGAVALDALIVTD